MKRDYKTKEELVAAISSHRKIKPEILRTWDKYHLAAIYDAMTRCPDYVSDQEHFYYQLARNSQLAEEK